MDWVSQQQFAGLLKQVFVATLVGMRNEKITPGSAHAEFARRLNAAMIRAGIAPSDIAKELGVDAETVRLWRRGERMPRDSKLQRLAKMIGVDPAELRYGEKEKPTVMPALAGEHVTDPDELALLRAYRGLKKEWARNALRRRAVELLEEFGEPGTENPWARARGTQ